MVIMSEQKTDARREVVSMSYRSCCPLGELVVTGMRVDVYAKVDSGWQNLTREAVIPDDRYLRTLGKWARRADAPQN